MSASHSGEVAHQFESLEQQNATIRIGIWAFLVQEVMFFGGLFLVYAIYRGIYPEAFAQGSSHLNVGLGTFNTVVLIGSSLTMALAVRSSQLGRDRQVATWIFATIGLALVFLGVKAVEYAGKFESGLIPGVAWSPLNEQAGSSIFYGLYFTMTGMHALHMLIGLVIMTIVAVRALRGRYSARNYTGVEILGLYWHFVDLVWIFLFPLLYLIGRHVPH